MLAGRDLRAGGTWMGVTRAGRFGVVTNFRELEAPPVADRTVARRGWCREFLAGADQPAAFVDRAERRCGSLRRLQPAAWATHGHCTTVSNRDSEGPRALRRASTDSAITGSTALAQARADPRAIRRRAGTTRPGGRDAASTCSTTASPLPATRCPTAACRPSWERALSAPFVRHERYGTRCSTVVLVGHDGRTIVRERRFDSAGAPERRDAPRVRRRPGAAMRRAPAARGWQARRAVAGLDRAACAVERIGRSARRRRTGSASRWTASIARSRTTSARTCHSRGTTQRTDLTDVAGAPPRRPGRRRSGRRAASLRLLRAGRSAAAPAATTRAGSCACGSSPASRC